MKKKDEKAQEIYADQLDIEELKKSPENILNFLKEKISASSMSLKTIFEGFDQNKDGILTFDEFC